jgi:hypothetical protein
LEWAEASDDSEISVEAAGSFAPDVMADLIARAHELWGWTFGEDADSETETAP